MPVREIGASLGKSRRAIRLHYKYDLKSRSEEGKVESENILISLQSKKSLAGRCESWNQSQPSGDQCASWGAACPSIRVMSIPWPGTARGKQGPWCKPRDEFQKTVAESLSATFPLVGYLRYQFSLLPQ